MKESKIPKFRRCVLQNFPFIEEDFDALTDYELLCKVVEYLNKVIDHQNAVDEKIDGLVEGFAELKAYVDNYFENLDVQEEINNKLEEMAEGGELATIISQFLAVAPVFGYNTVSDMKSATNLTAGTIARTLGFHSKNDKGGAYYSIVGSGTADERKTIALSNSLYAVLIETPETTVNQYGAYGDGVHDDYDAIQYAIENNQFGTVKFADCTYAINSTLKTYVDNSKKTSLILEPTTTIKALSNLNSLIELGGLGGNNENVTNRYRAIVGGIFDANNCNAAIEINPLAMGIQIIRVEIINAGTYGIYIPKGAYNYPSDLLIDECNISCTSSANNTVAIYCERTDNKFCNSKVNACKKGFYFDGGGQFIINVHGLQIYQFEGTTFIHFANGGLNFITDSYCDSFETFVQNDTDGDYTLTNSCYYSYVGNKNATLFKFGVAYPRVNIMNNTFQMPAPETKHKGVVFTGNFYSMYQAFHDMIIKDNQITLSSSFVEGDLLLNRTNYEPFWLSDTSLSTTQWLFLGYISAGVHYNDLTFNVEGNKFNANFKLERYDGNTYVTQYPTVKSNSNESIDLGFKYINSTQGYPVYAIYIKQNSGNTMLADITVHNNIKSPFIPADWNIRPPVNITETMDDSYTL